MTIWICTAIGLSCIAFLRLAPVNYFPSRLESAIFENFLLSEHLWSVGPLLDYLQGAPFPVRKLVMERLTRLLPQITADTAPPLTSAQRGTLHGLLNHLERDSNPDLRLAVVQALQEIGDWSCVGSVYLLATGEAFTPAAQAVRDAAAICLEHLYGRLDFGPLEGLSRHIHSVSLQMRAANDIDFQAYATGVLTLQQLLLKLTPTNYRRFLTEQQRDQLYSLPIQFPALAGGLHRHRKRDLHLEIVRTAERIGDTRAIKALQGFARKPPADADKQVVDAMSQALQTLEPLLLLEKESRTLLRGASAPDLLPDELLRAATPNASETDPGELLRAAAPYQRQEAVQTETLPQASEDSRTVLLRRTEETDG